MIGLRIYPIAMHPMSIAHVILQHQLSSCRAQAYTICQSRLLGGVYSRPPQQLHGASEKNGAIPALAPVTGFVGIRHQGQ